jgi:hypothetical protein
MYLSCPCQERTAYRSLTTEQSAGWLLSDLRSLGFAGTSFTSLDPASPVAVDLSGRIIKVRCAHREYQGQMRESWQIVRSALANMTRLPTERIRELDERFAAELAAHATKVVTAVPSMAAPRATSMPTTTEHPF